MAKITLIGAGSTVFAKNVIGDCIVTSALQDCEIALYDINPKRLQESENILNNINLNHGSKAKVYAYTDAGRHWKVPTMSLTPYRSEVMSPAR